MNGQSVREFLARLAALLQRRRGERDMADELEFHLAMKQEKYMRERGMEAARAMTAAKNELGGLEKWKEACRDVARPRAVEDFARDLLLAVRMLRKTPAFTAVALATLTLAIGANTAIFSLVNAIMLRPLAVPDADRLAILRIQPDDFGYSFNYPIFQYLQKHKGGFSEVFAFFHQFLQIRGVDGMERLDGQLVSGQYFAALGVSPELGRYIAPRDDRPGTPDGVAAVLSDRFWRRWFGGDPNVLGKKLVVSNVSAMVIGVMPKGFRGASADDQPDVFLPFEAEPLVDTPYSNIAGGFNSWWFQVGARLRDGVSLERANAFLRSGSRGMFEAIDPYVKSRKRAQYLAAEPGVSGYSSLRLRFRKPLVALMGLVTLLLLIACLNLATLLMVRAASRERELATRLALGASRGRLLAQLLTESMLLASLGTALGSAASPFFARLLTAFLTSQQDPLQRTLDVAPDGRVFVFTAALAALATILTGMAPALRSTGHNLQQRIREGSGALRGTARRRRWPQAILACEVALALVLVSGSALLGYSLVKLHRIPIGFEPSGLTMLQLEMEKQARAGKPLMQAYREIADGIAALPGVKAVSFAFVVPLTNSLWTGDVMVPGHEKHELYRNRTAPGYFRAMHTPLLAGREFRWSDTDDSRPVAILNESAARVLFTKSNPIGQTVKIDDDKTMAEVVGVVADAKYVTLRDAAPPTLYSSANQGVEGKPSLVALIRAARSPAGLIGAARAVVRRVVPEIPPPVAMTMDQTIAEALVTERMMALLALFFAGVALLITGIGLYGTLAYTTERRTGEIGIRMALGAQAWDVIAMVCRENGGVALAGCLMGLAASAGAARLIESFLYDISPGDPLVLGASAILLVSIAAAASLIPAVRASQIDAMRAIRYE